MKKDDRIQIRVDPELKAKLKSIAESEHRTLSNYIEIMLKQLVDKQK